MKDKRIGFVGAGNMAGALIKGLLHSGTVGPTQIQASDVREERLAELAAEHSISTTTDNAKLIQRERNPPLTHRQHTILDRLSHITDHRKSNRQ